MKRQKSLSVKVRAPSRGLVTRLPGESADLLLSKGNMAVPSTLIAMGSYQRASSNASNVRYANGVIYNAPGFQNISVNTPILSDVVAYWSLDGPAGTWTDGTGNGNTLTAQAGWDPVDGPTSVGEVPGLFVGAASFPSMPFWATEEDSLAIATGLSVSGSFLSAVPVWGLADSADIFVGVAATGSLYGPIFAYPGDALTLSIALASTGCLYGPVIEYTGDALAGTTNISATGSWYQEVQVYGGDAMQLTASQSGGYTYPIPQYFSDSLSVTVSLGYCFQASAPQPMEGDSEYGEDSLYKTITLSGSYFN